MQMGKEEEEELAAAERSLVGGGEDASLQAKVEEREQARESNFRLSPSPPSNLQANGRTQESSIAMRVEYKGCISQTTAPSLPSTFLMQEPGKMFVFHPPWPRVLERALLLLFR